VSVYKAEQKPPKRKVKLKNNKVKTKFKKTGVKCQPNIEPVENIENNDNYVKTKRQTKSEAISKLKCEAIIEPINEDEPFINNYRKRRKSKFPKLVVLHIQYYIGSHSCTGTLGLKLSHFYTKTAPGLSWVSNNR
jgi:hypothetical protein